MFYLNGFRDLAVSGYSLKVLDVVSHNFLIAFESVTERVKNVPPIVLHVPSIIVLARVVFAVPLDQDILIELDQPACELLKNRR